MQFTNLKSTRLALATIATIATVSLTIATTSAQAGGKHRAGKHYKNPYLLQYDYICKPQYIKRWVYSKRQGRKVLQLIRIEDRCNTHYH